VPLYGVPMALRSKAYLASCDDRSMALTGKLSTGSGYLETELEEWGAYEVRVDTVPPTIRRVDNYTWLIEDKVTRARYLRYRVTQDDAWVLANFDAKNNRLQVRRDKLGSGKLKLEVWDAAGNRAER